MLLVPQDHLYSPSYLASNHELCTMWVFCMLATTQGTVISEDVQKGKGIYAKTNPE